MPTDENSKIHPSSVYGITKYSQEQMVLAVAKSLNIAAIAFRYQNVYGPGQSLSNPYTGILSIFSTRILNGAEVVVFEDGAESRDFVFVDDVVRATIAGIEQSDTDVEIFNVGSGVATDVLTVANTLSDCYEVNASVRVSGNFRVGDIRHNVADLQHIYSRLGFKPEVEFTAGIRRFTNWVKSQAISNDGYDRSIEEMRHKGLYK
jgi:dTDP-L-rhamnose 4-epimerase